MDEAPRKCPYCAEEIPSAAIRCRYCRSRLAALDPAEWFRDHPGRRLAGVATATARALSLPVGVVRVAFLALVFFHFLGPMIYAALWLVIPFHRGEESPFEHGVAWVRTLLGGFDGVRPGRPPTDDSSRPVPGTPEA